ncbi:hypothetical protein NNO_1185 [Hydrogenimonas sp.]|nr:hypothetical protein NNO_1185 [Hydrogenimonas sp.]
MKTWRMRWSRSNGTGIIVSGGLIGRKSALWCKQAAGDFP